MPWSTNRPNTSTKYRTPEHRAERQHWADVMAEQGYLTCAQPECIMPTRVIHPGQPWATGHDDTGTTYIGPVHKRCNDRDGAKRGASRSRRRQPSSRNW